MPASAAATPARRRPASTRLSRLASTAATVDDRVQVAAGLGQGVRDAGQGQGEFGVADRRHRGPAHPLVAAAPLVGGQIPVPASLGEATVEVPAERLHQALQRTRADWEAELRRWNRENPDLAADLAQAAEHARR
ncbi:hypothetical protein ACFTY8_39265 [Streptomyces mirabilis]|uniref:hypothetical protein n=1 Tax=Streptomyces mirabilis TaxID=68239 RepID=UPI00362B8224